MRPQHTSGREKKEIKLFIFYSKYKRNSRLLRVILDERWKTYSLFYPFTSYAEGSFNSFWSNNIKTGQEKGVYFYLLHQPV